MKTLPTFLIVVLMLVHTHLFAQYYRAVEKTVPMGKQSVNAWVMLVGDEPVEALKKSFVKYGRQQWDVKLKKEGKDMLIARAAVIPGISAQQGDLKARFYTEGHETLMAVAFMPGYDLAFNTREHKTEMEHLCRFVEHFARQYKMDQYQEQLADHQQRMRKLEMAYEKNEREQRRLKRRLKKIENQLASHKTDEDRKFKLNNQRIADQSRKEALALIMHNQKGEILQVDQEIHSIKASISQLETLFAEPMIP